jgi:hypothetical protein
MRKTVIFTSFLLLAVSLASSPAHAQSVTTTWKHDAASIYNDGFMHMLMKDARQPGGVCLFNMELIENDAAGSGINDRGDQSDVVWGQNRARKILRLDDPRARKAWLVLYLEAPAKFPLRYSVNGHPGQLEKWDANVSNITLRWTEFPVEWLKKGDNVIELFCPEAQAEKDGWKVFIAHASEFEHGGGDPKNVGKTSFKSTDGGKTWKESPFGKDGALRAEYGIRFSLDRFVKTGWLSSPVIDLWKGDSGDVIVPQREIQKMKLAIRAETPPGTRIEYFFRRGADPQPSSIEWEMWRPVGQGASLDYETGGADLNRRYVQFKAALSTDDPLASPVIRSAELTAELLERVPLHTNIHVVHADNPVMRYPSVEWEWEKWDRPEFKEVRELENLDELIAGSRTEFDAQVKLLDYTAKRWRHTNPFPEYPGWDALSILKRVNDAGGGGMCIQFNCLLAGLCMAYGWQARCINVALHEVCEVWNDEYGKWIFLDADYENHYNVLPQTAEPLSMLDLHRLNLDYYYPDGPIDWMNGEVKWMPVLKDKPFPIAFGTKQPLKKYTLYSGIPNAAFIRMVTRNNWYEKPYPRPLNHYGWTPWSGYINWYDEKTQPQRQYPWHTDRPQDMWPDLNLVHVDAVQGFGNDRLFLRFETYTPNFSHFEVNADDTGWKEVGERWTWLLLSGRNTLDVRSVNKLGAKGKPSSFAVNHADAPFGE